MTDDAVFLFAQSCAKTYCNMYKSFRQFDDATQEACLWLLQHRDKWNLPDSNLRCRIIWALIRWYQNEHGVRLKKRPERVEGFPLEQCRSRYRDIKRHDDREMIETAIERAGLAKYRGVVLDLLYGYNRKEIAIRQGLPSDKVTAILEELKPELRTLIRACR